VTATARSPSRRGTAAEASNSTAARTGMVLTAGDSPTLLDEEAAAAGLGDSEGPPASCDAGVRSRCLPSLKRSLRLSLKLSTGPA
jgi:hypothetical protein